MEHKTLEQFSEELRQITDAAVVLFSINRLKLDPKTAFELESLKQSFIGPRNPPQSVHTHQTPPRQNQFLCVSTHRHQRHRVQFVNTHQNPPRQTRFLRVSTHGHRVQFVDTHQNPPRQNQFPRVSTHQLKQPPTPPIIKKLQGIIGKQGQSVEKVLEETDLNSKLQRVVFDKEASSIFKTFFSKEEQEILAKIAKQKVTVYDCGGKEYRMCYEVWKFLNSQKPVLYGCEWSKFCLDHGLKTGDAVTLSIFRHASTHQLCFFCSIRRKARTAPVVA